MKITTRGINYTFDTVDDLPLDGELGEVAQVVEDGRSGTFVKKVLNDTTTDGGTIFNGWERQYDGAVNVKWFIASVDVSDDIGIQKALDNYSNVIIDATYIVKNELHITTQYLVIEGSNGKLVYGSGDVKHKILRISSSNININNLCFSGNNKQPLETLVYIEQGNSDISFNKCTFKNIVGTRHGASAYNAVCALNINPADCFRIRVINCTFKDIIKYNDGVNTIPVVNSTQGYGFVGGIYVLEEGFNGSSANPAVGGTEIDIGSCIFNNITTILAPHPTANDIGLYADADAIRTFTTSPTIGVWTKLHIHDCLFAKCGKRAIKCRTAGNVMSNNIVRAWSNTYNMAVAIDVVMGNIIDGLTVYGSSTKSCNTGIQWKNIGIEYDGSQNTTISNINIDYCLGAAIELITNGKTSGGLNVNRYNVGSTVDGILNMYTSINQKDIHFDNISIRCNTNTSRGIHYLGGSSTSENVTFTNVTIYDGECKFKKDCDVNNFKLIMKNNNYIGSYSTSSLIDFQTSYKNISNALIDAEVLPDTFCTSSRHLVYFQGKGNVFKEITVKTSITQGVNGMDIIHILGDNHFFEDIKFYITSYISISGSNISLNNIKRIGDTSAQNIMITNQSGSDYLSFNNIIDYLSSTHSVLHITDGTNNFAKDVFGKTIGNTVEYTSSFSNIISPLNNIENKEGVIYLNGIPTTEPSVVGQLWNDAGTVKISNG